LSPVLESLLYLQAVQRRLAREKPQEGQEAVTFKKGGRDS